MTDDVIDDCRIALELAAGDDWDAAHRRVQAHDHPLACSIHAWLHRVEGDERNAAYWYRKAGVRPSSMTIEAEQAALEARVASERRDEA